MKERKLFAIIEYFLMLGIYLGVVMGMLTILFAALRGINDLKHWQSFGNLLIQFAAIALWCGFFLWAFSGQEKEDELYKKKYQRRWKLLNRRY